MKVSVSVPSFGDSFFIPPVTIRSLFIRTIVSVPSFGDSFFIAAAKSIAEPTAGFRPLIRGFFFYPVVMICRQV